MHGNIAIYIRFNSPLARSLVSVRASCRCAHSANCMTRLRRKSAEKKHILSNGRPDRIHCRSIRLRSPLTCPQFLFWRTIYCLFIVSLRMTLHLGRPPASALGLHVRRRGGAAVRALQSSGGAAADVIAGNARRTCPKRWDT